MPLVTVDTFKSMLLSRPAMTMTAKAVQVVGEALPTVGLVEFRDEVWRIYRRQLSAMFRRGEFKTSGYALCAALPISLRGEKRGEVYLIDTYQQQRGRSVTVCAESEYEAVWAKRKGA
jgi:hypothetical protein